MGTRNDVRHGRPAGGTARGARFEQIESRLLLSAYTLNNLGQLGLNASGANPQSPLVIDAGGNFYGTAAAGGAYGQGTVFEIVPGSSAVTPLASFNGANGQSPYGGVVLDVAGNLFGTTYQGGASNAGTVFEIAKGSNAITTLVSFDAINGQNPSAGLTIDGTGDLFGTTQYGGASGAGTVFEIPHGSTALTTIASFSFGGAAFPQAGVTLDASGNLYGTTTQGGTSGLGALFEIAAGSTSISVLASFDGSTGSPASGVAIDAFGNLYGTTAGTVFELPQGASTITRIVGFPSNAGTPSGVTLDSAGDLFGKTAMGGPGADGTVFEIAHGTTTLTTLAAIDNTSGPGPVAGVTLDAAGNLYGTTRLGGTAGTGSAFEIPKGRTSATTIAAFDGINAAEPNGPLALDASGDLFGTSLVGGPSGEGNVFEIAHGSTSLTSLASFNTSNGACPFGGVAIDEAGNLYGATQLGGANGDGTVFEIASGSKAITTLASFNFTNGANPQVGVTLDAAGNLYGTTVHGGTNNNGTVFELAKGSNAITALASYARGTLCLGGVTADASGNVYGTIEGNGSTTFDAVFEIAKGSASITTLATFDGTNGASPRGGVMLDAAGNLYGTTASGGANNHGGLFEIARGSNMLTLIATAPADITGLDSPSLAMDAAGNIYGTSSGGSGSVFEVARGSGTFTTLVSFGAIAESGITADGRGNLYGATANGGPGGAGTVFELAANTAVTLAPTNGSNPSAANQPLAFTATVSGGVPDGETVMLADESNNNAVVSTGTLAGGSATLTVAAGTLSPGTHNLVAAYAGDANFAPSQSAPYAQVIHAAPPTLVGAPVINGDDPNGLFNASGQGTTPGVQRSMVEDVVYIFNEPVTIPDANAAFTIAVAGSMGVVPTTLIATAVPGSGETQWAVSLTGKPVGVLASIGNGEYSIAINPAYVFAAVDGTTTLSAGRTDTFDRLYGDFNGDRIVNNADNLQFKRAQWSYNPAFDYNGDGFINNADNLQLRRDQAINFFSDGFVTTI